MEERLKPSKNGKSHNGHVLSSGLIEDNTIRKNIDMGGVMRDTDRAFYRTTRSVTGGGTQNTALPINPNVQKNDDYQLAVWNLEKDTEKYNARLKAAEGRKRSDPLSKILR